ncbi:MAG: S8 family serine peptidase, partial [Candidatus Kapaibacterium sp.]
MLVYFSTLLFAPPSLPSPVDSYRVFLVNKGVAPFVRGSSVYEETKALLTDRCLQRRAKVLPKDSLFTLRDAPLYAPYLDDLRKSGATVLLHLRWTNHVVVECDSASAEAIRKKAYVRTVTRTGDFFRLLQRSGPSAIHEDSQLLMTTRDTGCGAFRYGASLTQNRMLATDELHAMGVTGASALMGMIDNGFRWRAHDCFNDLRVQGEYDFMFRDSVTGNDSLDVPTQDGHGTGCLSIAAGFLQDSLIGTAPNVAVLLAKTEDMRYERRIEEDRFAAAMEWLESRGVDVTSSSVGYDAFDSTDVSYPYDSLNGHSTICARAVNIATSLGVVCLTAAGNSGGVERTIITPGDADSAFTVGAFKDDSLNVAGFTSKGPNAAGLIKPDFATLGKDVVAANLASRTTVGKGNGTSFATPALAGAVALLIDQYPSLRPYEIRSLLRRHASRTTPDNEVGYGLPNVMRAAQDHGIVASPLITYAGSTYQTVAFFLRSAHP